jgi:phosphosulfolactate synthase
MHLPWAGVAWDPLPGRSCKPRVSGLSVVIDHGIGIRGIEDLVELACEHIDIMKLTSGTSAVTDLGVLQRKVGILRTAGINVQIGGTFTEVCVWQGLFDRFLERAIALGVNAVEISDGTITMDAGQRARLIRQARDAGLMVLTEVGRKEWSSPMAREEMCEQIRADLGAGAFKVIIEAMDAGKGVGIFDEDGRPRLDEIAAISAAVSSVDQLIWEAPLRHQQEHLVLGFGPEVNLGNIWPHEVLPLEALRRGLTGPTFRDAYLKSPSGS